MGASENGPGHGGQAASMVSPLHVSVRVYEPADFEALHALDRACYPPRIAYSGQMLREYLEEPGAVCLVAKSAAAMGAANSGKGGTTSPAEIGAQVAGFVIANVAAPEGHIITLDVGQARRREGIGSALLAAAEGMLAALGVRKVFLETATNNEAGIAFWRHHGYVSFRVIRAYYPGGLDAFQMSKTLAE